MCGCLSSFRVVATFPRTASGSSFTSETTAKHSIQTVIKLSQATISGLSGQSKKQTKKTITMHNCSSVEMKKMSFLCWCFNINCMFIEIGSKTSSVFLRDCIFHDSVMAHEELCSPSERTICQREQECTGMAISTHFPFLHLSTSFSIHSTHAFNIRGQINWLPAAEDTYLLACQLCTRDPNTKTGKHFITLMLNSKKREKKAQTLEQHRQTAITNTANTVRPRWSKRQWSRPPG